MKTNQTNKEHSRQITNIQDNSRTIETNKEQ